LAGKRVTVVEEQRGVTRDRKAVEVEWGGLTFDVVDTGGWLEAGDSLEAKVSQQAEAALRHADLVLLVVDATTGHGRRGHPRRALGPAQEAGRCSSW
jgi:GTP-binding protein